GLPHRRDRQPHLRRGVREPAPGPGGGDGRGAVRRPGAHHPDPAALLQPTHHLRHVMTEQTVPTAPAPAAPPSPPAPRGRRGRSGRRAAPSWAASRLGANLLTYAFLLAGALVMLGPFVFSVLTAVKTPHQFNTSWPLT